MKTNLILILFVLLAGNCFAQQKKAYQIKIKTLKNETLKGNFHQVNDSGFVVISNKDTSFVRNTEVKKLKVYEKGILIPSLLTGGGTVGLLSLVVGPMAGAFLIVGVPVGLTVGYVVSNTVATKKRYRDFQSLDKSLVRLELQSYAQINR
ncbi:hypothetical protein [Pedobacter sp.]|uniref:hypothetical protein n=1 Tax=Pedobacter sp. TaxID=1411316 RepID=UPI0031DED9A8